MVNSTLPTRTCLDIIKRYTTLIQRVEIVAEQACLAANRPDLYVAILEANLNLMEVASRPSCQKDEIVALLIKLRRAANEACTVIAQPQLYAAIVEANFSVVTSTIDIAHLRRMDPLFDQHMQEWTERGFGFQQGRGQTRWHHVESGPLLQ